MVREITKILVDVLVIGFVALGVWRMLAGGGGNRKESKMFARAGAEAALILLVLVAALGCYAIHVVMRH